MRTITLVGVYVLSFIAFFYILSLAGIMYSTYSETINSDGWKGTYSLFFGWWLAALPTRELYLLWEDKYERIF